MKKIEDIRKECREWLKERLNDEYDAIMQLSNEKVKELLAKWVNNGDIELLTKFVMSQRVSREERLKLDILEQMDFTIWACDKELNIKLWEGSCPKVYQITKDEALGHNYLKLFVEPVERRQSKEDTLRIIRTGTPQPFRYCDDVDGRGFPIQVITQCCRVYDDDNEPLQAEMAVNMNYDKLVRESKEFVREKKREQEEIEEARNELIDVIDTCRMRLIKAADMRINYFLSIVIGADNDGHQIKNAPRDLANKAAKRVIDIKSDINNEFFGQKQKVKETECFCDTRNNDSFEKNDEYTFDKKSGSVHSFDCIFRHNRKNIIEWRKYIERKEIDFLGQISKVDLATLAREGD